MKFENIEEAKKELVNSIMVEYNATLKRDHKLQEKSIKRAFEINTYIKENFDLKEMKNLLDHKEPKVQIWVAKMLLPIYENISLKILDDISKKNIPHCSYNAKMMLYAWKNNM